MPIFKIRNKRGVHIEDAAMAGAYIEKPVDSKLALYAVYLGISKAGLISSILKAWKQSLDTGEWKLIDAIAQEIEEEFKNRMQKAGTEDVNEAQAFARFINEIHESARRRGMYNEHILKLKWRLHERREKEKE